VIRAAVPEDVPEIYAMVRELASFEKLEHQLTASVEDMQFALFEQGGNAEALVGEMPGSNPQAKALVGYAIFFENFSTFLCKRGIYLEDVYVRPQYRKRGIGKAFLQRLANHAVERNCGRMEWSVLDWNQNAIDVYESIGGEVLPDWRIVRLGNETIKRLAEGTNG
jgi:GNAT superfamily N-acetyltransferase